MLNVYNIERKEVMVEEQKDEDCQDRKGFIPRATGGFDRRQQADDQHDRSREVQSVFAVMHFHMQGFRQNAERPVLGAGRLKRYPAQHFYTEKVKSRIQ